jgi:hypothetical protein
MHSIYQVTVGASGIDAAAITMLGAVTTNVALVAGDIV